MMRRGEFRFLYRQAEGCIGPGEWRRATALPAGLLILATLIAIVVAPGPRDLASQPFISVAIIAAHAYLIVYGFALIFVAVAQYYVSAKRFNDLGKSAAWAGLAPFALLVAGALIWFQPRSEGMLPRWSSGMASAAALGVVIWNVFELGFTPRRK